MKDIEYLYYYVNFLFLMYVIFKMSENCILY